MQTDDGPKPEELFNDDEIIRLWNDHGFILVNSLDEAFVVIKLLKSKLDESACGLFFGYATGAVMIQRI